MPKYPPLVPSKVGKFNLQSVKNGLLILEVFEGSPSHELGVQPGWKLIQVDNGSLSNSAIKNAQFGKHHNYTFVDENDTNAFELSDCPWPFGMLTTPLPTSAYLRKVAKGKYDPEDLSRYWRSGLISPYKYFSAALETYLSNSFWSPLSWFLNRVANPQKIARHSDYQALAYLTLAKIAEGKWDEAAFYLGASTEARQRLNQQSYSGISMALEYFAANMIAEQENQHDVSLETMQAAKSLTPDADGIELRLAQLEDREPKFDTPEWTLKKFPIDYNLPNVDPVGEIKPIAECIRLSESLKYLNDDEFLMVFVLGHYRSNYYYNLDLIGLAKLYSNFPERISAVHAITSGDYALDKKHRHGAEGLAKKTGLPLHILWDENESVENTIHLMGSPSRFLIDKTGVVYGTERLMEEEGFWKAIHRKQTR